MHWILQNNLFDERGFDTLLEVLERAHIPYSIHKVIPFIGELTPEATPASKNVICMGSYSMRHTAVKEQWYPGVFDLEPMDFTVQMEHWGDHMLNADATVVKFGDMLKPEHAACWLSGRAFLRPIHDSKCFAGKVFEYEEVADWVRKIVVLGFDYGSTIDANTLVQICPVRQIYAEYRFWVVKGEIVTASMYKRGDKVFYSDEVDQCYYDYVKARIAEWQPLDAFVIDVCSIPFLDNNEPQYKIVEINTINSAGFYAANMQKLVYAFEEHFSEPEPDCPWEMPSYRCNQCFCHVGETQHVCRRCYDKL